MEGMDFSQALPDFIFPNVGVNRRKINEMTNLFLIGNSLLNILGNSGNFYTKYFSLIFLCCKTREEEPLTKHFHAKSISFSSSLFYPS
jgi:hypothetical protein